jgi:hypothetical protein
MNRRFAVGSAIGAVLGFAAFAFVVTGGQGGLAGREPLGGFFDSQAKALLDGHWDVPGSEVFIEGFQLGDKVYTYFGIWPTVLRMPVLAFGDEYYGRLTQLSMLLALAVGLLGTALLNWRIRSLVRPERVCSRAEAALAGVVTFTFACGTAIIFLASRAWVYHEAIVWGVAWSLLAYDRLIAYVVTPRAGRLVAASAFATLAFSSRPAAGAGAVAAIALVLLGQLLRALRERISRRRGTESAPVRGLRALDWLGTTDGQSGWRRTSGLALAFFVPVAAYAYVNWARFDSFFRVPWRKQFLVGLDLRHQRVLDANGGTYFGLKFAPTTLLHYLRPDALGPMPLFPFVTFPRWKTPIIGDLAFDTLDWSTSVPASMPALMVLAIVGAVAVLVPRYARTRAVEVLRVPILAAAAGVVLVLALAVVSNRYLGDWVPLLALGAITGLHVLLRRREEPAHRRAATVLLSVAAVAAVFGVWVNGSLAILYQRLYNPKPPGAPDPYRESTRAGMLGFQYDIDALLGGSARAVDLVDSLPATPARSGTTAIVGNCAAMYWSDGRRWHAIERTRAGGRFRFRARPAATNRGEWYPVLSWGPRGAEDVVGLRLRGELVHLALGHTARGRIHWLENSPPEPVDEGGEVIIDVEVDRPLDDVRARANGRSALAVFRLRDGLQDGPYRIGRATPRGGVAPRFAGDLVPLPVEAPLCERIRDRAR